MSSGWFARSARLPGLLVGDPPTFSFLTHQRTVLLFPLKLGIFVKNYFQRSFSWSTHFLRVVQKSTNRTNKDFEVPISSTGVLNACYMFFNSSSLLLVLDFFMQVFSASFYSFCRFNLVAFT